EESPLSDSHPPPHRHEQSTLVSERAHPTDLREPSFDAPVVLRLREQLVGFGGEHRARVCAHVLDVVLREPALYLRERVAMFLRMPVLIADPRLAPRRFVVAIAQHGIERDPTKTGQTCNGAPQS